MEASGRREELVLVVDDDPESVALVERILSAVGYRVASALSGEEGLAVFESTPPTLVLLDVEMPGMNGYAVAQSIREGSRPVPVVFITAHGGEDARSQALSLGAVGYLVKPFKKEDLLEVIAEHIGDLERWERLANGTVRLPEAVRPDDFELFKKMLAGRAGVEGPAREVLLEAKPGMLYEAASAIGVAAIDVAEMLADFLNLDVLSALDPGSVDMEDIPAAFGERNHVVRLVSEDDTRSYAISNPFDWELLDVLESRRTADAPLRIAIVEPEGIHALFRFQKEREKGRGPAYEAGSITLPQGRATLHDRAGRSSGEIAVSLRGVEKQPVVMIANHLILEVLRENASDIHIEPEGEVVHVRFRIDGDMYDATTLALDTGTKLTSRLKALAGLDISERRRPQSGSLEVNAGTTRLNLRLATALGPHGESLVIRVLDTSAKTRDLGDLGMTDDQATTVHAHVERAQGVIVAVGPTGSGKTTTIHRILLSIDVARRSIISVEDPVEYLIPRAQQQQVNEKAGLTFNTLLRSSVRQDPDVLFVGEVRDAFSAATVVEFASTGHLTVTTLNAPDATSAVSRLELFDVSRSHIADAISCLVAQRLVKRLCPECRVVGPTTEEERRALEQFTEEVPETTARAGGCPSCREGYSGREGLFEVVEVDERFREWLRTGVSAKEIRTRLWSEGAYLMHRSALDKIREHVVSVDEVYDKVLIDYQDLARELRESQRTQMIGTREVARERSSAPVVEAPTGPPRILVAEDDESTLVLLQRVLSDAGYEVTTVSDGEEAFTMAGSSDYDLILSDLRMPGLDGLALIRELKDKGVDTPVLMLTGSTEGADEAAALEMGAADFVHKPIRRDVLLLRVERALAR